MKQLSSFFTQVCQRFLPDPFVFAIILTLGIFISGIVFTGHTPVQMVGYWGNGFWNLLSFAMQMSLILVTGHAIASAPFMQKWLPRLAGIAKTPKQGVMLVTFLSAIASTVNWGFGAVFGALFAKVVAQRIKGSDYRLLIASSYIGMITWGGGLSGTIPLLAATPGNPMEKAFGLIPIQQTLFSNYNIFITIALILILPIANRFMMPKPGDIVEIDSKLLESDISVGSHGGAATVERTFAVRVENSKILTYLIVIIGYAYVIYSWVTQGFKVDINTVNLISFITGLLLHGSPMAYMRAITGAAKGTAAIMVQFPFYAGMQGMMDLSGLGTAITHGLVSISTRETLPLFAFLSSGIVNFFIPSAGGHWVIQGPVILGAAHTLGASPGLAAMAIGYGECWMNMAQPFWALPALAIAGLGVRDIMGYCITTLFVSGVIFIAGIMLF
ncbi:short-chain fatty acid transporter [Paenibacillus thalictri]|uniref:Short-chain fatty acid transporter n=1 Tax=Paenibacillus thalictri TaxID=2527873 RepID=A0A4Q9DMB2_9BACL|nr:TIGR00366 family protein [Paenibacillus thalictri]TBL72926.1 short-chain fatty acid transporter [Paenibacillus thalictri]